MFMSVFVQVFITGTDLYWAAVFIHFLIYMDYWDYGYSMLALKMDSVSDIIMVNMFQVRHRRTWITLVSY